MSFKVQTTPNFEREAKRLIKKYKSLKHELAELIESLEKSPTQGMPLGNDVFKIRLSVRSKGKGKSGGARVITWVKILKTKVYLISIYSKGEKDDISNEEIQRALREVQMKE